MSRAVYDTRFFVENYYSPESSTVRKLKEKWRNAKEHFISAIVVHEVYQLTLRKEGRETAILRAKVLEEDYKVVNVDVGIARFSAELRFRYRMSMADSIIAATACSLKATCISDDPHFKAVKEIKTEWI
jgi:predicted nucleic acid-binding protein